MYFENCFQSQKLKSLNQAPQGEWFFLFQILKAKNQFSKCATKQPNVMSRRLIIYIKNDICKKKKKKKSCVI